MNAERESPLPQDALGSKMETLANMLAQRLIDGAEIEEDTTDVFKALSTYYTSTRKSLKVPAESTNSGGGFVASRQRVADASKPSEGSRHGGVVTAFHALPSTIPTIPE